MIEKDLKSFVRVTANYFEKVTKESVEFSPPVIEFQRPALLDYTGIIGISGAAEGCVYLTAGRPMLETLIPMIGAYEPTPENLKDMIGEIANVIASNVRKDFGSSFKVSVPVAVQGDEQSPVELPPVILAIPIQWREHRFFLVLGLSGKES